MKCKDCKHYNGATMPGAGLCNATQARTFATTVCFNGLFSPKKRKDKPDSKAGKKIAQRYREIAAGVAVFLALPPADLPFTPSFSFCMEIPSPTALPVGTCFSGAKVLPWRNIQVPLRYLNTIFQQLSRFSIVHISRTLNTATIKFCPNSLPVSP